MENFRRLELKSEEKSIQCNQKKLQQKALQEWVSSMLTQAIIVLVMGHHRS